MTPSIDARRHAASIGVLALALIVWPLLAAVAGASDTGGVTEPLGRNGLRAADMAVVINTADPLSVAVGDYYILRRHIAARNVARIAFAPSHPAMSREQFEALKAAVDIQLPASVQAYALTWAQPYRVECMSITSAFALGFDEGYCGTGCVPTKRSPYYNSDTAGSGIDMRVRPTMSLAAASIGEARALINRGILADGTFPKERAYLLISGDDTRDVRARSYPSAVKAAESHIGSEIVRAPALRNRSDVMFYFIGAADVPYLETNRFNPGAVADHLTSLGGELTDSSQMSALRWLEAGATGSYGTVVEPCNMTDKFPNPAVLMRHYLAGETLIEAYWKSVAMPGQGIFIGEPLATPYRKN